MPNPTGAPLDRIAVRHGTTRPAVANAAHLLGLLGARIEPDTSIEGLSWDGGPPTDPAFAAHDARADWAGSGAMALTGPAGGAPLVAPGASATAARGAALAIRALTTAIPWASTVDIDGARLLAERAALAGLERRGAISPGGSCRLVPVSDGLLAVNLSRPDDLALLGAWLETDTGSDPWAVVHDRCSDRPGGELADRAQLLGIPVARVPEPREVVDDAQSRHRRQGLPVDPWRITVSRPEGTFSGRRLVVDLSSMWAGPLCAHLLGLAGFDVVKVESATRPDGARRGPARFYDLLHHGHRSVALDFSDETDLARLSSLLGRADIVVESSRPRALDQLGLGPAQVLERSPSTIWVAITGYGRVGPWCNRVAFGDDAAAAAGLIAGGPDGQPVFCGDAVADPLAGLHGALGALAMHGGGRGGVIDVALRDVVASTFGDRPTRPAVAETARATAGGWVLDTDGDTVEVCEPTARSVPGPAAPLGADTDEVIATLSAR